MVPTPLLARSDARPGYRDVPPLVALDHLAAKRRNGDPKRQEYTPATDQTLDLRGKRPPRLRGTFRQARLDAQPR